MQEGITGVVEKMRSLFEYVKRMPGHKNSKGESAPWTIVSHKTGKVLSSHKTKKEAEEHLRQMHIFKEGVMLKEDYTKFDKNTGTLWHTYGSKTKRKINLFLKLAKEAGHKIEQHGGNITIITPNGEDYYTSTVELSKMTDMEIMDYVEDLLEPMEDDLDESCRPCGRLMESKQKLEEHKMNRLYEYLNEAKHNKVSAVNKAGQNIKRTLNDIKKICKEIESVVIRKTGKDSYSYELEIRGDVVASVEKKKGRNVVKTNSIAFDHFITEEGSWVSVSSSPAGVEMTIIDDADGEPGYVESDSFSPNDNFEEFIDEWLDSCGLFDNYDEDEDDEDDKYDDVEILDSFDGIMDALNKIEKNYKKLLLNVKSDLS